MHLHLVWQALHKQCIYTEEKTTTYIWAVSTAAATIAIPSGTNMEHTEVVTTQNIEVGMDEEGNPILEEQPLEELIDEVFLISSIPYLMFFTKQVKLPNLIQVFSSQFVNDNINVWTKLK